MKSSKTELATFPYSLLYIVQSLLPKSEYPKRPIECENYLLVTSCLITTLLVERQKTKLIQFRFLFFEHLDAKIVQTWFYLVAPGSWPRNGQEILSKYRQAPALLNNAVNIRVGLVVTQVNCCPLDTWHLPRLWGPRKYPLNCDITILTGKIYPTYQYLKDLVINGNQLSVTTNRQTVTGN